MREIATKTVRFLTAIPSSVMAQVGIPKLFAGMQVTYGAESAGEDEKYAYYLANPGYHEFIGK